MHAMAINWKVMNWVVAGVTLGGIAITGLFCWGFQHRQDEDQQALENWKKAMRAKREKFELTELNLARAPKEGNGAPALLEAVAELRGMTNSCPLLDRSISGLKLTAPGKALVAMKLPDLGPVVTEHWHRKTPTSWEDLDREMKVAAPLLDKIREAIRQPVLAVDVDYQKGFEYNTAPLQPSRAAGRWLGASVIHSIHQNRVDAAIQDIESIISLTRLAGREPGIMCQMLRDGLDHLAVYATWQVLQSPNLQDGQLVSLQKLWQRDPMMSDAVRAYEMERVLFIQELQRFRSPGTRKATSTGQHMGNAKENALWIGLGTGIYTTFWTYADEWKGLRMYQELIEALRKAQLSSSWLEVREVSKRQSENIRSSVKKSHDGGFASLGRRMDRLQVLYSFFTNAYLPNNKRVIRWFSRHDATVTLTRTAVALKRYQLRQGRYPERLDQLVPDFLSAVPIDPMVGQPLRYRLNANGTFTLYSVGDNGTDEAGDPNLQAHERELSIWNGLDIVWPVPAER